MAIEYPFRVDAQPVEVARDPAGWWTHPSFPWDSVPGEAPIGRYLSAWGFEGAWRLMNDTAPPDVINRWDDGDTADCSYWTPEPPNGDGWFLAAIYDTEDGPCAMWVRPIAP